MDKELAQALLIVFVVFALLSVGVTAFFTAPYPRYKVRLDNRKISLKGQTPYTLGFGEHSLVITIWSPRPLKGNNFWVYISDKYPNSPEGVPAIVFDPEPDKKGNGTNTWMYWENLDGCNITIKASFTIKEPGRTTFTIKSQPENAMTNEEDFIVSTG